MYDKILLCYDGSREGRLALREGAWLAKITGAGVVLLAVVETVAGNALAQGADVGVLAHQQADTALGLRRKVDGNGLAVHLGKQLKARKV